MVKASAGGGGKGMRVAYNEAEAREAFQVWKKNILFLQFSACFHEFLTPHFHENFQPIFFVFVKKSLEILGWEIRNL